MSADPASLVMTTEVGEMTCPVNRSDMWLKNTAPRALNRCLRYQPWYSASYEMISSGLILCAPVILDWKGGSGGFVVTKIFAFLSKRVGGLYATDADSRNVCSCDGE